MNKILKTIIVLLISLILSSCSGIKTIEHNKINKIRDYVLNNHNILEALCINHCIRIEIDTTQDYPIIPNTIIKTSRVFNEFRKRNIPIEEYNILLDSNSDKIYNFKVIKDMGNSTLNIKYYYTDKLYIKRKISIEQITKSIYRISIIDPIHEGVKYLDVSLNAYIYFNNEKLEIIKEFPKHVF